MSFEAVTNHREYLSAHYLAEILPGSLKKGLLTEWVAREKKGEATPRQGLRGLRSAYFAAKSELVESGADDDEARVALTRKLHQEILAALGLTADRLAGGHLSVVEGRWAEDTDSAGDPDSAGRLFEPVEVEPRVVIASCFAYASHLLTGDDPPRYVLILNGPVLTLADRHTWAEGRYLAANLDVAFGRNDTKPGGELDTIAALFGADGLLPPQEGGDPRLATVVGESRQHAVGVSSELRDGLRRSVELIANEVLARLDEQGINPAEVIEPKILTRDCLRYLYRILFLLYAEARPELGVLPVDAPEYAAGYSMARLGDLVWRPLGGEQARRGLHLYQSLDLLFRLVDGGHNPRGNQTIDEKASEGKVLRFEPMRSDLFRPDAIRYIGESVDALDGTDTRLRNATLYQVLRLLMLTSAKRRYRGRRSGGKLERGGFISYAQLGINQLGAVYEGLMSYTGFIAAEELYEVAKGGDPKDGSWMIPASKVDEYPDEVFVTRENELTGVRERVRYRPGSFVYRLAGRDRQTSASYYTPQSLTEVTVQLALKYRLDQDGTTTKARELLDWTICEPALGSGAFLNEAINQVAAEYLRRRQDELDTRIDPDQYATELQKVKTYIALHNSYGVDLNATAVELAEVSIWLNVMHRGLQAPWFGLHLRRGNSLIGGRRQYYTPKQVKDKAWLTAAPANQPLRDETWPNGAIHHFLLPADGWGAVAGEKEAKALAPEDAKRLADWRRKIKGAPDDKQLRRLQAVAKRVEALWRLVRRRLQLSEEAIRRDIDVWGVDPEHPLPRAMNAKQRDEIKADLEAEGGPYWRLKTLMDTWCVLWFWPLDKADLLDGSNDVYHRTQWTVTEAVRAAREPEPSEVYENTPLPLDLGVPEQLSLSLPPARRRTGPAGRKATAAAELAKRIPLASVDDWLTFAEALIGRTDIPEASLVPRFTTLAEMDAYEHELPKWMGTDSPLLLHERFPWLEAAHGIAEEQGFFHWEVEFAHAFVNGGFDLQVGNPPWVRTDWDERGVLAEHDPWFALTERPDSMVWQRRRHRNLGADAHLGYYLDELRRNSGDASILASPAVYPILTGTRPDRYRAFMCQVWRHMCESATAGLIHPDSHFDGVKERRIRKAAYRHLRVHGGFVNAGNWAFSDANRKQDFGVHIYGGPGEIDFKHVSQLFGAEVLPDSLAHNGVGPIPAQKHMGAWDLRPHRARVITVNRELLREWQQFAGHQGDDPDEAALLYPVTSEEQGAISALAAFGLRIGLFRHSISAGFNEANAKRNQVITYSTSTCQDAQHLVLQGPHLGIGTPFSKEPRVPCRTNSDWDTIDLTALGASSLPRTNYVPKTPSVYFSSQDTWEGEKYSRYYRLAWRRMIPNSTERSLFAALIPPGPTHVHAVNSLRITNNRVTAANAGFWASLPLDYIIRATGRGDLQVSEAGAMPAALPDHALESPILLRTLRLNCLTRHYEPLWTELFDPSWTDETWVVDWPGLAPLGAVGPAWEWATALRTERERRAALVEIDALVSVWLGIGIEELIAVLRSRYPILTDREDEMWFDSAGRRIARDPYAFGHGQEKTAYDALMKHLDDPDDVPPPEGYTAPFYKADREAEYRQAHAVFSARLQAAKEAGWTPSTPEGAS